MKSWTAPDIYKPFPRNVLFYEGPSLLTGAPILVVATASNGNRKIGQMVQLWILPSMSPIQAVRQGTDDAVCGDCKLRGNRDGTSRSCYVEYWRSVENIHQGLHKAERMSPVEFACLVSGLQLRIGAFGDPVAVPMSIWLALLNTAGGWTAYTHQWRRPEAQAHRAFVMASVDSAEEYADAIAMGWRTFRVRASNEDPLLADEVMCPASEEGGHRAQCDTCSLCRGLARPAKSIAIVVHGSKQRYFPLNVAQRSPLERRL